MKIDSVSTIIIDNVNENIDSRNIFDKILDKSKTLLEKETLINEWLFLQKERNPQCDHKGSRDLSYVLMKILKEFIRDSLFDILANSMRAINESIYYSAPEAYAICWNKASVMLDIKIPKEHPLSDLTIDIFIGKK
jgi:hypothetical protein